MSDPVGDFIGGMAEAAGQAAQGDLAGAAAKAAETTSEAAGDAADAAAEALDSDGDIDTDDAPLESSRRLFKIGSDQDPFSAELIGSVDLDPTDGDVGAMLDLSAQILDDDVTLVHADGKVDVDTSDREVGASGSYEDAGVQWQGSATIPTPAAEDASDAENRRASPEEPARLADESDQAARDLQDTSASDNDTSRRDFEAQAGVERAKASTDEPVAARAEKPERPPDNLDEAARARPQPPPDDVAEEEAARLDDVNQQLAHELQEAATSPLVDGDAAERGGGRAERTVDDFIEDRKEALEANREMVHRTRDRIGDDIDDLARLSHRADVDEPDAVERTADDFADAAADTGTRAGDLAEDFGEIGADLTAAGRQAARDAAEIGKNDGADGGAGMASAGGAADVSLTPSPAGPIPVAYPNLGAAADDAEDVAAIAEDLAGAGSEAATDAADASGITDFDVTDPFGSGAGTEADPSLNADFGAGAGSVHIPGPLDSEDFGGGVDQDHDGDTDLDDVEEIIGDAQDDVEEEVEEIIDDVVDAADTNDDGTVDEEDLEDAIEDNTGIELDLNPLD